MNILQTNGKSVVLLSVISMAIAGCGQKETLLSDLNEDGGIYYHEGVPYSGIGFSNWTPERRKKTVEFKDGQIRKSVRYFQSDYIDHPMDSLVFNEKRDLIYQKRWVNDTLSVEGVSDMVRNWSAYSMRFNPMQGLAGSSSSLKEKYRNSNALLKSSGHMTFQQFLDSFRLYYSFDHPFVFNQLASVFGPDNNQRRSFPAMLDAVSDLHFTGGGAPQIDGRYMYPEDLYMHPIYGAEDYIRGVHLDLYSVDEDWDGLGEPEVALHEMSVYTDGADKSDPHYHDLLSNQFYLVDSLRPNAYRIFMRPIVDSTMDIIEDQYRPLIFVLEMDFNPSQTTLLRPEGIGVVRDAESSSLNPFNLSVDVFSWNGLMHQRMTLAMQRKYHLWVDPRKSAFDDSLRSHQKDQKQAIRLLNEAENQSLRRDYDQYYAGAKESRELDAELGGTPSAVAEFWIVVKQGKTNVNVRKSVPSGEVIGTVNGGDRLLVSRTAEVGGGVYLLNKEVELTSMDGLRSVKRPANYQLHNVKAYDDYYEADIQDDNDKSVRVRVAISDVQPVDQELWYYLPEWDGYVFGGLVRRE